MKTCMQLCVSSQMQFLTILKHFLTENEKKNRGYQTCKARCDTTFFILLFVMGLSDILAETFEGDTFEKDIEVSENTQKSFSVDFIIHSKLFANIHVRPSGLVTRYKSITTKN